MNSRIAVITVALAAVSISTLIGCANAQSSDGVVRVKSTHDVGETVKILERDIAAKGIKFFSEIDQAKLAADAGIQLRPSIPFGNPPLGVQFLTANPFAGLDWPVRMLVLQDADGQVWIAYSDFAYIG